MGRQPATYAGVPIMFRVPLIMQTTLEMGSNLTGLSFPERPITHGIDRPFEIHRMIPRCSALDSDGVLIGVQPDDDIMEALVQITIRDFGKNNSLTKGPTYLGNFVKGSAERTWEWADPYYFKQGDGFEIGARTDVFPAGIDTTTLRVQISFEGFLVTLAPPTEQR